MKVELRLNDSEEERLKLKAAQGGLSVSELLTKFAHDLIHGSQTSGSDERLYANGWYDRCGFTYGENSFLSNLAWDHVVEEYLEIWQKLKESRTALADKENEDIKEDILVDIEEYESELQEAYRIYGGTGDWEKEMAEVERKWVIG